MILNLTQHPVTAEQKKDGVKEIEFDRSLLTFDSPPTEPSMVVRATELAIIASRAGATSAMIGGAPYFMSSLEVALLDRGIEPIYAFSVRNSIEVTEEDGSVIKKNIFRHAGFVRPYQQEMETDAL